jgi:hypothetical protein
VAPQTGTVSLGDVLSYARRCACWPSMGTFSWECNGT